MPQKYDIIMGDKFEEFHQAFKDVKKCESKKFCFKKSFKINGKETIGSKKNEFNSLNHNNKQILNNEEYIQNHPEGNSKSKYVFKRVDPVDLKNSVQPIQHKAKSSQINNTNKVTIINSSLNPSKEGYIDVQQTKAKSSQISNTNKVTIINSSLNPSKEDFMDDEEFERRFGNGETSNQLHLNCNNLEYSFNKSSEEEMKGITLNDFDLSDINWEEHFDSKEESKCNKNNLQTQSSVLNQFNRRKDDSEEFQGTYPHSEIVFETLNHKFGLQSFRPHQREIINASLNSHDIFVLMPTGGGKSLCYQLPAILAPGVTIVISPLRALISDQVDKLNALDIPSAHLCSDVSKSDTNTIFNKLCVREPLLKLLYLTPEKIVSSCKVLDMLKNLYERDKLARVVIDEAHCLSQWGHDFRPDYKQLSLIRRQFSKVPIICLTATATKQVQGDVVNILHLKDVKTFIRSFNRPNIKYKVIPKSGKNVINEIAALIKSKFLKKSGIIYCLCRADCDNLAKDLCRVGIKAKPYHAGMADKAREKQQREWMQDQFHVIVATIAFGMGIDKPDVRFVIHNSIPKSVEAFYQESGRGGRDGKVSYSYLFYNYNDVVRLQKLITMDRSMKKHTLDGHFESLKQMVSYAENKVDCRRYLQLVHLGEYFDKKLCLQDKDTICDNCENVTEYKKYGC
ncbi:unnamed protein product [Brassicogethes aeneus]|uniref:ATP-dependent DNA helicase n=1 Tax=Brassicogethes aeneus TaxID=1431903 RepID=A0A9P0AVC5_BRAAE|nr:unnamed protein product [Brassicogethes aeneus]